MVLCFSQSFMMTFSIDVCVCVLQRVFVMPNMDDIPISLMCAHLQPDADDNDTDTAQ